jgi:integrase
LSDYAQLGNALLRAQANGENPSSILAIKLLALTGCRRGEVERLTWSELDLPGHCLRPVSSKEGRSVRPIGQAAITLIARSNRQGKFVLPGRGDRFFTGLPKAWRRIVKEAGLKSLTPHGLRHAYASIASDLGYSEATISALIGHATHTMTARYIHHLDQAFGLAVATLAKLRCLGGGPAYLKLGRKVVYRRADLADWLNARRVTNTAQAALRVPRRLDDAAPQLPAREINE